MNENVAAFLKVLDSTDNTTGGGTASAIAGAMAGALVAMVARLSVNRDGSKPEAFYQSLAADAERLSAELFDGGRGDSLSFEGVRNAYRMKKRTEEEKAARSSVLQSSWLQATLVPLENAERCAHVLRLGIQLQDCSNPNTASDLACALLLALTGLKGCLANVDINIPHIKDPQALSDITERTHDLNTYQNEHVHHIYK